jgi:hypothetical protein
MRVVVADRSMLFFRRLIGVLVLDPAAFESIEADARAGIQSVGVVVAVTAAGGLASIGLDSVGVAGFVTGAIMVFGGWLVWVSVMATLGTTVLAEPATRSSARELLRTLGFASAPGVFLGFAAMRSAAPLVFAVVAAWMVATAVLAVRQALDYRSTARAVAVCTFGLVIAAAICSLIALALARPVG